jgi:hypothetical protein
VQNDELSTFRLKLRALLTQVSSSVERAKITAAFVARLPTLGGLYGSAANFSRYSVAR